MNAQPDLAILQTRVYRGPNLWSYEPAVQVRGKPGGQGSGQVGRVEGAVRSARQASQSVHAAAPQPWQLEPSSRSPAAARQRRSGEVLPMPGVW